MTLQHDWSQWGRLRGPYQEPRPRRMLALDSDGFRGMTSLQALKTQLRERFGEGATFASVSFSTTPQARARTRRGRSA